jgi:hypothetical protein
MMQVMLKAASDSAKSKATVVKAFIVEIASGPSEGRRTE